MKKVSILLILLMLVPAACVSVSELPEQVKIQAPLPQKIESVLIRPTTTTPAAIKNIDSLTERRSFLLAC